MNTLDQRYCSVCLLLLLWAGGGIAAQRQPQSDFADMSAPARVPHNVIRDFSVEHFSIEQGFANEGVETIIQDHHGFIWILTDRAVYRYDGLSFRRYEHNPQDSTSLFVPTYLSLHEDKRGRIWIGGAEGLQYFDAARNVFVRVRMEDNAPKMRNITVIVDDPQSDNLWLGVGDEVWLFHSQTMNVLRRYAVPRTPGGVDTRFIGSIILDSNDYVYVTRRDDKIIARLDTLSQQFRVVVQLPNIIVSKNILLHQDSLWVASVEGITLRSIREQRILAQYTLATPIYERGVPRNNSQSAIVKIYRDSQGRIWVATTNGIVLIYPQTGFIQRFRHDPLDNRSLSTNEIYTIYEDRSGVIWIGEGVYGLHKYAPMRHKFSLYRHNPFDDRTISNNYVRGIIEDRNGNLWVGTQFGGLNMLNRKTGVWTHYRHNSADPRSISSDYVCALHEDNTGLLWIGVRKGYLSTFDPKHPERGFERQDILEDKFSAQCFYQDRAGYLWIGTFTNEPGLYRVSPDRKTVEAMHKTHAMPPYCKDIQTMYEDRHGRVWIGTINGLFCYDRQTQTFREFFHNEAHDDMQSISHNFVTSIIETKQGEMWISTKGGGICRYNSNNETFTRLTTRDGLPHNNCYAVIEGVKGELWISTDNGICEYTPQTKAFRHFSTSDGLQGREFNRFARFKSRNGEIFFGGVEGLNSFFPQETRINTYAPQAAFLQVRSLSGSVLHDNISLAGTKTIDMLPPNTGFIVECSALEFTAPERNLYSWYIDNVDSAWSPPSTAHQALYSNLAPGSYVFRLKVSNGDGVWSHQELLLTINIIPAWWQRWWFRIGAAAGIVGAFLLIVRWRVHLIHRKAKELEALVAQRTQELQQSNENLNNKNTQLMALNVEMQEIMGIASHDLKNPISAIIGLVELMRQPQEFDVSPETHQQFLEQILHSGNRMLDLLRNLLDTNALDSGEMAISLMPVNMNGIVQMTIEEYHPKAAAKHITIHYTDAPRDMVYADEMMVYQVIANLISNAVKYSPLHRQIWVRVLAVKISEQSLVRVEIQDEGPGLSAEDQKKLFQRFMKLSARPTANEDSTGLGLSIVKKMVEAMRGRVWCESVLGEGATFVVEFPMYDTASSLPDSEKTF